MAMVGIAAASAVVAAGREDVVAEGGAAVQVQRWWCLPQVLVPVLQTGN